MRYIYFVEMNIVRRSVLNMADFTYSDFQSQSIDEDSQETKKKMPKKKSVKWQHCNKHNYRKKQKKNPHYT